MFRLSIGLTVVLTLLVAEARGQSTSNAGIQQLHAGQTAARQRAGLAPQELDAELNQLAQEWANYMASSGNFRHSDYRITENIAWGQRTPQEAITGWMNSAGHRRNLLSNFTHVGFGFQYDSRGRPYWVSLHRNQNGRQRPGIVPGVRRIQPLQQAQPRQSGWRWWPFGRRGNGGYK